MCIVYNFNADCCDMLIIEYELNYEGKFFLSLYNRKLQRKNMSRFFSFIREQF